MSTLTAVDTSKQCQVTNNSNQSTGSTTPPPGYDIVVTMPIKSNEKDNSTGALLSSTNNLEILRLSDGKSTVIKQGSSDTVTLDRTITDDTGTIPEYGYDLIISTATWVRPLANISVSQNLFPAGYDPLTLTADDFVGMDQAKDFYQTIAAYPTSKLAKDYVTAITATNDSLDSKADGSDGSATAVNDAIASGQDAFFQNTKGYKQVTADRICVLDFYYNNFPFVWANYQDTATYFIYSNSDDGSTTTFAGTLTMTKTGDVDITKLNGNYTCLFNPAVNPADLTSTNVDSSKAKTLTYSDGMFVEDISLDNPTVALKGSFTLKRTFTKNTADTAVIVVLAGTIGGLKSLGFDESQAKKADDSTQDWLNSLFHPTTAAGIFNSVMTILGALMMLHFVATTLFGIGKWIKSKLSGPNAKNAMTQEDVQKLRSEISDLKTQNQKILDKLSNGKEQLPDNSVDAQAKASTESASLSDQVSKAQIETNLNKANENLQALEKNADVMTNEQMSSLQDSAKDVRDVYNTVEGAQTPEQLSTALDEVRPTMSTMTDSITQLNTDVSAKVSGDALTKMEENSKTMTDVQKEVEEESKVSENEEADTANTDPEAETTDFPAE